MRVSKSRRGSSVLLSVALVAGAVAEAQAQNGARYPGIEQGRQGMMTGRAAGAAATAPSPGLAGLYPPATGPLQGIPAYGAPGAYGVPPTVAYGAAPTAALGAAPTAGYDVTAGYGGAEVAATEHLGPILGESVWQFVVPPPQQTEWTYVPITELRQVTRQVPVTRVVQVPRVHYVTRPV